MVAAIPSPAGEPHFDLGRLESETAFTVSANAEHLAIRGATGLLRLDVIQGTLLDGPVRLLHRLGHPRAFNLQLPYLRQLCVLCAQGGAAGWTIKAEQRIEKLILALRVLDARDAGASLRDIAIGLDKHCPDWPGDGESTKSRIRRLVAFSQRLRRAGPRGVLRRAI